LRIGRAGIVVDLTRTRRGTQDLIATPWQACGVPFAYEVVRESLIDKLFALEDGL